MVLYCGEGIEKLVAAALCPILFSCFRILTSPTYHLFFIAEARLTAAQLANQVWLIVRGEVSKYYDSHLCYEDEITQATVQTRNLPLQIQVQYHKRSFPIE